MPLWMLVRQGMFFLNLIVFLGMLLYECSGQKKRTELFMDLVVFLSFFCMATAFYSLDLVLEQSSMSIFTVISGGGILYAWIRVFLLSYKRKQQMSIHVIQESFDNLPCGIAFFDGHGFPRLVNRQMQAVFQMLMERDLQSEEELRKVLDRDMKETSVIYPCRNGQVWQLTEDRIVSESGKQYTQFLAFDVTELYEKKQELEQENRKLEEVSVSLKELSKTMMQVTREEEVLAMKMKVHDELGYHVLATQQLLTENPDYEKIQELLNRWKQTICLLKAEPEASEKKEKFSETEERAQVLGLKLEYSGIIPADEKIQCLLNEILLEAVNNAVRHGHAAVLEVTFKETEPDWYVDIRNDGIPPKETIREGGGLTGIRKRLEAVGGNLQYETDGRFIMKVCIPKEADRKT